MKPASFTLRIAAILLGGWLAAGLPIAARAQGTPTPAAAPPSRLAVINVVGLFKNLTEELDAQQDIDKLSQGMKDEVAKRTAELEKLQDALAHPLFNKDSAEYKNQQHDLLKKAADLQAFQGMTQQEILMEMRVRTAAIYRKINDAVAKFAQANGIALVFVVDDINVENARSQEEIQGMVTVRKVLYFHPAYDITSTIQQQMNTAYALGPGKQGGAPGRTGPLRAS